MFFVDALYDRFRRATEQVTTAEMLRFLMSPELVTDLLRVRIFPPMYQPDGPTMELLAQLLHGPLHVKDLQDRHAVLIDSLVLRGCLVHVDDNNVALASPAVRAILVSKWLRPRAHDYAYIAKDQPDGGFMDFHRRTLAEIDSARLASCLSQSALRETLVESMWQHVYFKAACSVLPAKYSLSCDIGRKFKSSGRIDFYINSTLRWGIELTRENLKLTEHLARFAPGGLYYPMVASGDIANWVVLNFCQQLPSEDLRPRVVYAVYNADFTQFTLHYILQEPGGKQVTMREVITVVGRSAHCLTPR